MAHTRVRIPLLALTLGAGLSLTVAGCASGSGDKEGGAKGGAPAVVATTTWEGAFAKAAGAKNVEVIVPSSAQHAPDYDPKPSDLAAVADADFVLYAPFEPYAEKIKEAAGSDAELVEQALDNDAGKVRAEVTRLGKLFGTEDAAAEWNKSFDTGYATLQKDLKSAWPDGKAPGVVAQVFSVWTAKMAGAEVLGTYGPETVTAKQLSELSRKKPSFVLDNVHMSSGEVLPGSGARQVGVVNYPGEDLDLLSVYRDAARTLEKEMNAA
ncbi:zinc ABC transporter substrate-binding protein [Streptomyces sp. Z26]|uniref:metal ABC transporter solute-binding protein, Zn/Mn family n=1 Tax=Streptomyces sp. Z26 TaxID=2500177 RepID=UPI000EF16EF0|nr:zinc ABC transporter substrate-binding protein [Streptomyces sp. Z26]RLL67617.1 ABC transporter substrate-binding protein [Streptomyces sp. Z26]